MVANAWTKKVVLLVLVCGCGCAIFQDQRASLLASQTSYITTVNVLIELREAGKLDDDDIDRVTRLINAGEVMLDEWAIAVLDGKNPQGWIKAFKIVLNGLVEYAKKERNENNGL